MSRLFERAGALFAVSVMERQEMRSTGRELSVAVLSVLFVGGCGGDASDRPMVAPVKGTVTYEGKPVEGASVAFWTDGAPRAALGVTNAQGEFQLTTFESGDGAVPGEHTVTVTKTSVAQNQTETVEVEDLTKFAETTMASENAAPQKSLLPEKYGIQGTTPLRKTVSPDGPNELTIEL